MYVLLNADNYVELITGLGQVKTLDNNLDL